MARKSVQTVSPRQLLSLLLPRCLDICRNTQHGSSQGSVVLFYCTFGATLFTSGLWRFRLGGSRPHHGFVLGAVGLMDLDALLDETPALFLGLASKCLITITQFRNDVPDYCSVRKTHVAVAVNDLPQNGMRFVLLGLDNIVLFGFHRPSRMPQQIKKANKYLGASPHNVFVAVAFPYRDNAAFRGELPTSLSN